MKYKVHHFKLRMTSDQLNLERFLNSLDGEIVAIIPNASATPFTRTTQVDFLLNEEKAGQ